MITDSNIITLQQQNQNETKTKFKKFKKRDTESH